MSGARTASTAGPRTKSLRRAIRSQDGRFEKHLDEAIRLRFGGSLRRRCRRHELGTCIGKVAAAALSGRCVPVAIGAHLRKSRQKPPAQSWIGASAVELGPPDHTTLRRYSVGVRPADLRKAAVNELVSLKPISRAISVTDWFGLAKRIFARSMRRLV